MREQRVVCFAYRRQREVLRKHLVTFPRFRPESDVVTQVNPSEACEEVMIYINVDWFPPGEEEEQLVAHETQWRQAAEQIFRQCAAGDVRFHGGAAD